MSDIARNWARLKAELKELAPAREITVVAVTKFQDPGRVREAIDLGIHDLGNNYVQQGDTLREALGELAHLPRWHFIGHIQSRKVKELLSYDCIQSLDRVEIVRELAKRIKALKQSASSPKVPRCLIEVNIGREPSKSGVLPEDLPAFVEETAAFPDVPIDGLMAMPPPLESIDERRRYFDPVRAFFDRWAGARRWTTLSMGTSEDYAAAIRCGATMIRLGTSLLGPRPARPSP